jgi:hypothetical protein
LNTETIVRLALAGVLLIPLAYAGPLIATGLEDLNAVRHLDSGEFETVDAWVGVYPRGPFYAGPFKIDHIYPKAFYNLAGVFLYPYSAVYGEDFRVVLMVWRGMNALLGAGAVLILFLLVRRVFGSSVVALAAAGLFAVTPEFLNWAANVRPNPLEQALIFATLLACVGLCEGFSHRLFLLASLAGALAFATKYGGMPFLLLIPAISVYAVRRRAAQDGRLAGIVEEQARALRLIVPPIAITGGMALAAYGWIFSRYDFDGVALFTGLTGAAFPPERLDRVAARLAGWRAYLNPVAWGIFGGLLAVELMLAAAWRWARAVPAMSAKSRPWSYAFLFGAFVLQTAAIYLVTFFAAGPAYLVHPEHFVSQVGWMVYYSGFAGSYGGVTPTVWGALQVTAGEWAGWGLLVPLGLYALYAEAADRSLDSLDRDRRLVLWIYILISSVMFVTSRAGVVRHVLPAIGLLYGVVCYAVGRGLKDRLQAPLLKQAVTAAGFVLLTVYAGVNVAAAFERLEDKLQKPADVGFEVGSWLRGQYDPRTRILTDKWTFYVPPEFANVSTIRSAEGQGKTLGEKERAVRDHVTAFDPDVIILADLKTHAPIVRLGELLRTDPVLQSRGYRLVKRFESRRRGDKFEHIRIYEKTADALRG